MIVRICRLLTQTGAALLVVGFFVVVGAIFTPTGSLELLKKLAESTPGLELTYRKGTLSDRVVLDKLYWQAANGTTVTARDLDAGWKLTCWSQKVICLRETKVARMVVKIPESGNAEGQDVTLPAIRIPIPIEARSLKIDHLEIHKFGSEPVVFQNIQLSAFWLHNEIKVSEFSLDWLNLNLRGEGSIDFQGQYPLEFTMSVINPDSSPNTQLTAHAKISGTVDTIKINATLEEPFAASTVGTVLPFDKTTPLNDFYLSWENAFWPLTDEQGIRSANGSARFSGNYQNVFISTKGQLTHPALPDSQLKIFGILQRTGIDIDSGIAETLGGTIELNGAVQWQDSIDWNLQLQAANISPDEFWPVPVSDVDAEALFAGNFHNDKIQFGVSRVDGTLNYNDTPLTINGNLNKDQNNAWHFDNLAATTTDSEVRLNGTLGEHSSATAAVLVNSEMLSASVNGMVQGRVDVSGNWQSPTLTGTLQGSSLTFAQYSLENATIDFSIHELLREQSTISLTAQHISFNDHSMTAATASFNGRLGTHDLQAAAQSETLGTIALAATGHFNDAQNWSGTLQQASATPDSYQVNLVAPVNIDYEGQTRLLAVAPHCWQFNETSLCVDEPAIIGQQGNISFHSENLNLSPLSAMLPAHINLSGNVDSRGRVTWQDPGQPVIALDSFVQRAELIIDQGIQRAPVALDFDNAKLLVDTNKGIIKSQLSFESRQLGSVSTVAHINTLAPDYPVWGDLKISNADSSWLQPHTDGIRKLRGSANGDVELAGTLAHPLIQGEVNFVSVGFESDALQTPVTDLGARINFSGSNATFTGSAITAGAPVEFSGGAAFGPTGLTLDTTLAAQGINLSNEYIDQASLDAEFRIRIAESQIDTSGSVTVNSGTIQFGDPETNSLQHSSDVIVLQEIAASDEAAPAILKVSAGVDVSLGDEVRFRGWGLDAKLLGSVQAHLSSDKPPQVVGEITIDKGTYRSYGQDLAIRNGKIHFIGPPGQAALTAEAIRQQDTLTAGLRLEGSIQAPTATLFSEPALPDEEILSYLVLGRSLDDRSDRQAQLLANAALYVGLRNGQTISDNIAKIFGIEDFYVTATGSGDHTQLMVSGRLTNRLLLRYGIGIFTPINTLYLRYDLAERLYVESTRGIERAVDLYYSFEF